MFLFVCEYYENLAKVKYFCLGKKIIWKMWFKGMDLVIYKMSSPAKLSKSNERGMKDCDEQWKGKSEIQSTWEKIYTLYCEPITIFGTKMFEHVCFMKFRYFEDYKKMKKINEMLGKIMKLLRNANNGFCGYSEERYIYKLKGKLKDILIFLEECNFLNVDFDDGKCFEYKFFNISDYILNGDKKHVEFIFCRLLNHFKYYYDNDEDIYGLYYVLQEKIMPLLVKIRYELLRRGIKIFD